MPRLPRDFVAGVYHIAAHGSSDRHLFHDDRDRIGFLELLDETWTKLELELVSYVLMTNHYHVVTWTPDARLSKALQIVHGRYSYGHNRRHHTSAHLFRNHCASRRISDNDDLLTVERYLARNPVKAGLVLDPLHWPWSSVRAHAGLDAPMVGLADRHLRAVFGGRDAWRARYAVAVPGK